MLLSICTATNNPAYLQDTFDSILKQTDELSTNMVDWEWIVILDGIEEPEILRGHNNIILINRDEGDHDKNNIGALKKKAFQRATGDLLIDLDHDDILEPGCLMALANAALGNKNAFFYGDSAGFKPDGSSPVLNTRTWDSYNRRVGSYDLRFHVPPEPSPYFLANPLTIPHQPRAWTKEAYQAVGGFDSMPVAAEHELVCRTYHHGIPMIHVQNARSMYRIRGDAGGAMSVKRGEFEAQAGRNKWLHLRSMISYWCRENQLPTAVISSRSQDKLNANTYQWHQVKKVIAPTWEEAAEQLQGCRLGAIMFSDFLHVIPAGEAAKALKAMMVWVVDNGWLLSDTASCQGRAIGDPRARSFWNEYTFTVLGPDVGLEVIACNLYYPTVEHKNWDLSFVRADMCKRGSP